MGSNKRSQAKPRKYNPKPNKVCVGQFLTQLYGQMQQVLKSQEASDAEKATGAWVMNITMLEITEHWCRDPWCKDAAVRIKNILTTKQKDEDGQSTSASTDEGVSGAV